MSIVRSEVRRRSAIVFGVLGASLLTAACKPEVASAPEPVRPAKVMKVEANAPTRQVVFSGSVKARSEAQVGFRVGGKIIERLVNVGDHVGAGTVLARLDTADLALGQKSAEAGVVSARSARDVAQSDYDRNKTLFGRGFIAQSILDGKKLALDQAVSTLDSAISARDQAVNQSAYAELKAPGPGIVTEIRSEAGQVVSAGGPVVVIAQDGEKEVAIAVPENEIRHFNVGDRLGVRYWADPAIVQTGTVREISGSADPTARTFAVRVSLPADARVRLGMTATLVANVAADGGAIIVPIAALAERDGKPIVWVVNPASGTVAARSVKTEAFAADGVRIAAGLSTGDLVVTAGTQFMTADKKVRMDAPQSLAATAAAR